MSTRFTHTDDTFLPGSTDSVMLPTAFSRIPTEIVELWTLYLDISDLRAFRLTCRQAHNQTLQTFGQRYLSAVRTSLMGPSLEKLSGLATHKKLRRFIKTIYIQDGDSAPGGELEIWPRNTFDGVASYFIEVEALRLLFLSEQLRPATIVIRDVRPMPNYSSDPEVTAKFADDILANSGLAVVSYSVRKTAPATTNVTLQLDAQHQGQWVGFSKLRSAELVLSFGFESDAATNVLYKFPFLEDLKISFCGLRVRTLLPASHGHRMPRLKRMEFSSTQLRAEVVLTILTNSQHTLNHLSFRQITLAQGSTWHDLLTRISNEFCELTSFSLKSLNQGVLETVRFQGLDHRIPERYEPGLELLWKGRPDSRWVNGISYQGPEGSRVLGRAAACVVTRGGMALPRFELRPFDCEQQLISHAGNQH